MLIYVVLFLLAYLPYSAYFNWYLPYTRNLSACARSGIHTIRVPVFFISRFWLVTHRLWLKVLAHLPHEWTKWVDFTLPELTWDYRHEIFDRTGHDTFLTCAPGGIVLWTCEAGVISQITTRRNDFPKMTRLYGALDVYGKNVVSSEGQIWRHHRKATSPPFTEKNNQLVWAESIDQGCAMLASWVGRDGKGDKLVDRVADDTMRLSLHVISRAGFGRKMEWPDSDAEAKTDAAYVDRSKIKNIKGEDMDEGHTMSYTYALHCLLDTILLQFLVPRWLLSHLPFKMAKRANEAFGEWGSYMRDAMSTAKTQVKSRSSQSEKESMDILAQLVKGQVAGQGEKGAQYLTDSEIMGNMFVLILAGHETAANSIHFALIYLALYIPSQRRLQKDLDQIFQGRKPEAWDYERDLPALFGGMAGAVLAEELRLVPPVTNIPKSTVGVDTEQPITIEGRKCLVPKGIYIGLAAVSVHRNPKYWPSHSAPLYPGGHPVHPTSNLDNDLEEFKPERWLLHAENSNENGHTNGTTAGKRQVLEEKLDSEGIGVNEASDTSDRFFKPPKGAYIPFSDGYRSCLGRRFAQVEVLAVLAVIFQQYSVELDVSKYAKDEEIDEMQDEQKGVVWQKAAEDARDLMLNGCGVVITLQMRRGHVGLRFVPRGTERFKDDVDDIGKSERQKKENKTGKPGDWTKDSAWRAWNQRE